MNSNIKDKAMKGVVWNGIERISVQGINFLVLLVLARNLTPHDFGLVGMLTVFISIAQAIVDGGFSLALIRKTDRSENDSSTVFIFNIILSFVLCLLLFISAPWVAGFYEEPLLKSIMRVLCIVVVINSFSIVQKALFTADINFRSQAKISFLTALVSGATGIICVMAGMGVWALVLQQIASSLASTILFWISSKWHPKFTFSMSSFHEMFTFGSKMLLSTLINTIYTNLYQLLIGKVFSASHLGYYSQANTLASHPTMNLSGIIQRVSYPVLCTLQNDDVGLERVYRKIIRISSFILFPIMCCLAGIAKPLIIILVGEKWLFASVLLVPLCFTMMLYPLHVINLNLLQVKGRSDLFLKLEIIKKVFGFAILMASIPFGLLFMCYTGILSSIVSLIINTYYTGKLIQVGFISQVKDVAHILGVSLCMFVIVKIVIWGIDDMYTQLLAGILIGGLFFFSIVWVFHFKEIDYLYAFRSVIKSSYGIKHN